MEKDNAPAIRRAQPQDAALLARAEQLTSQVPGRLVSQPDELHEAAFREKILRLSDAGLYAVAEIDGQPVGHALLEPGPLRAMAHVFSLTIVVHPGHTGRGIGRSLMAYLLDWAQANPQAERIELRVRAGNEAALGLYRRFGFEEEGRLRQRIKLADGRCLDEILMARMLRNSRQDQAIDFSRVLIIGNCGSGKSWLAERLARRHGAVHLDLDTIHWLGSGYARARERSDAIALARSAAAQPRWVIEGIYGWLAIEIVSHATLLVWICLDEPQCVANIQARGPRGNASAQSFHELLEWAQTYRLRTGSSAFAAHQRIFASFPGARLCLTQRHAVSALAEEAAS